MSPVLNRFLEDFVKGGDRIIIRMFYPEGGLTGSLSPVPLLNIRPGFTLPPHYWRCGCCFPERRILTARKLVVSVNPSNLFISGQLFVLAPQAGRVNVTGISGSLVGEKGVKAEFNWRVASGNHLLYAEKETHHLFASYSVNIPIFGLISGNDVELEVFS